MKIDFGFFHVNIFKFVPAMQIEPYEKECEKFSVVDARFIDDFFYCLLPAYFGADLSG